MENTKKIIQENSELFPEFVQYFNLIQVVEEKIESEPDITIETCKALIEWISKTIVRKHKGENYIESEVNSLDLSPLVWLAIKEIANSWIDIEDSFIKRTVSLIQHIWEIRNNRGEISHGKHSPKSESSSIEFARLTMLMTDAIIEYFLAMHYSVQYEKDVEYSDFEVQEFNQFLDEKFPSDLISYSKALFDQDKVAYKEQYDEFRYS